MIYISKDSHRIDIGKHVIYNDKPFRVFPSVKGHVWIQAFIHFDDIKKYIFMPYNDNDHLFIGDDQLINSDDIHL